jgi:hypothetical protein
MSALHHGRFEVAAPAAGLQVYTAVSVEHVLPGRPEPITLAVVARLIPTQRRDTDTVQTAPEGAVR